MANLYSSFGKKSSILAKMLLLLGLLMACLDKTGAQIGVCYGLLGDNLPSPQEVVTLYNQNNIRKMRLYGQNQAAFQALTGTNIELMLGVPNEDLQRLASDQANANSWVQNNVRSYPNVKFRYLAVGNEIRATSNYAQYLLPAMRNLHNVISVAGLGNQIKVSTAVSTGVLGESYPPSRGSFRPDIRSFLDPIIQFLVNNRSPLLLNMYPYFSYIGYQRHSFGIRTFYSSFCCGARWAIWVSKSV